ncbi:hypothetical protein CR513_02632, partial [Mucuna pruriens]
MTQIREQMNKLYELFTQKMTINAVPTQETPTHLPRYAPQPYGMPYGENTNTEDQHECQRQEQAENIGGEQTQGQRTTPRATVYYHPPQNPNMTIAPPPISNEKLSSLEDHGLDTTDLCLVPNIILPIDFKVPMFEKYKGSSCPPVHLAMYCRKWLPLYTKTTFWPIASKTALQRWRELVAQVQPPLSEKEMVTMFIDTFPSPVYDKVVGSVATNFADLVIVGERIEFGIKRGKFAQTPSNIGFAKKTMGKSEAITFVGPTPTPNRESSSNSTNNCSGGRNRVFTPIHMPYTTLLPKLLQKNLIVVLPLKPLEPPYPRSYDPNAKCEYHVGAIGHSTKRCWSFKHKVQDLIDAGWLGFEDNEPNVRTNPLPAHGGQSKTALSHEIQSPERREASLVRSEEVAMIRGEPGSWQGELHKSKEGLTNWTAEELSDEDLFTITNNEPSLNDNAIHINEDPISTEESIKDDGAEIKALVEIEKWIEQEKPKFQPWAEELESVNLGDEKEKKEVKMGKQMPLDLRIELIKLLKEYFDIFTWSYRDMPGLNREIV